MIASLQLAQKYRRNYAEKAISNSHIQNKQNHVIPLINIFTLLNVTRCSAIINRFTELFALHMHTSGGFK